MITLSASAAFGQSGQFIARLTGRDSKFTFNREFIGRKGGKRNDVTTADVDDEGLFEHCDVTRKGKESYFAVTMVIGGTLTKMKATKEEAMAIAKGFEAGRTLTDLITPFKDANDRWTFNGVNTPAQSRKASEAQTVQSAIDACWAALQSLPEKEAKKVLIALRAKVSPPPVIETTAGTSAPAGTAELPAQPESAPAAE